ncbi:MAG: hypothetical protein ACLS6G_09175 [Christensenellales bacterium]
MGGDGVSVTVSGGVITDATILSRRYCGIRSCAKEHSSGDRRSQSTEVAAAGATVTSAIKTAVQNALDGVQEEEAAVVVPFDHIDVTPAAGLVVLRRQSALPSWVPMCC